MDIFTGNADTLICFQISSNFIKTTCNVGFITKRESDLK